MCSEQTVHTFSIDVTLLNLIRPSNKSSPGPCYGPGPVPGGGGPVEGKVEASPAVPATPHTHTHPDLAGRDTAKGAVYTECAQT